MKTAPMGGFLFLERFYAVKASVSEVDGLLVVICELTAYTGLCRRNEDTRWKARRNKGSGAIKILHPPLFIWYNGL